eukprot:c10211_g1_i1.p1 GENE.c10211_g1_i1~~c10211_g1_i1.p1  ORF type:complete len:126 (+),score=26.22 c10211_g1_i1:143-520(+)
MFMQQLQAALTGLTRPPELNNTVEKMKQRGNMRVKPLRGGQFLQLSARLRNVNRKFDRPKKHFAFKFEARLAGTRPASAQDFARKLDQYAPKFRLVSEKMKQEKNILHAAKRSSQTFLLAKHDLH